MGPLKIGGEARVRGQVRVLDNRNFDDTDDSRASSFKDDSTLWGVYSPFNEVIPGAKWDVYWLLRDNDNADDEVYTVGTRVDGACAEVWDWNIEIAYQFGDFAGLDQNAWAWHSELGYTLVDCSWKPRVALEYNYATGDDDPNDGDHETFDNLYPTNHMHYGAMDILSWRNGERMSDARYIPHTHGYNNPIRTSSGPVGFLAS